MTMEERLMRSAFVFYAPSQLNSFVKSGVVSQLLDRCELNIYCTRAEIRGEIANSLGRKINLVEIPWLVRKISGFHQMLTLWRYKDRSMNHLVRAMASFGSEKERLKWKCVVVSEMKISFFKRTIIKLMSHNPIYKLTDLLQKYLWQTLVLPNLKKELMGVDSLIVPFSGHIGADFGTIVWSCKKIGKKVIAVQENWDNLSTKTFITEKPHLFLVWGNQSASHLRSVHRIMDVKTKVIGSPRFHPYFSNLNLSRPSVSKPSGEHIRLRKESYILIAGTGDGIDDVSLVETSHSSIQSLAKKLRSIQIVYRPHPMTRTKIDYESLFSKVPNLLVDDGPNSRDFGHHHSLVANAILTINHFSTLAIESVIAGVPVVIPLFLGRNEANYRYDHILNEWHHMMGLALIDLIKTPIDEKEFADNLISIISRREKPIKQDIDWICHGGDYVELLIEAIK
jgi:hypothetical protein